MSFAAHLVELAEKGELGRVTPNCILLVTSTTQRSNHSSVIDFSGSPTIEAQMYDVIISTLSYLRRYFKRGTALTIALVSFFSSVCVFVCLSVFII
jgi:hypothetical protein